MHETDGLPRMICDSCIIQLNVAYNFKMKTIESDTKLRQFVIEKGLNDYTSIAITDSHRNSNSITNFMTSNNHALCDFAQPADPIRTEPIHHPDTAAIAHEYLRNFETPQSLASTAAAGKTIPFRCMPIQIKVEYMDEAEPSPTSSESNLHTVSDTSSVRSNEHLNGMVRVGDNNIEGGKASDEEFVNTYIRSGSDKTDTSPESKSSVASKRSLTNKPGPKSSKVLNGTTKSSPEKSGKGNSENNKKQENKKENTPKDSPKKGTKRKRSEAERLDRSVILNKNSRRNPNDEPSVKKPRTKPERKQPRRKSQTLKIKPIKKIEKPQKKNTKTTKTQTKVRSRPARS